MTKTTVKIGSFKVDDAELTSGTNHSVENILSIPCKSDPDLCKQLDGWDEQTSIPAFLDGKEHVLYRQHYDHDNDAWIMRLE
ncbi:DUF1480 family protein [Sodalis ligni]|jgi:hypothetical protein|uniref:Uncharacterized protein DUF1480 n=1 Tax=Sodalis ligni TaxID=2697027 RepID=A0A4R1N582_9GAMM|nr:DUF1480 family protein [Sodalis ligni]QWA09008.1 DUF1480 family protein [Sodalis ligni]TCL02354.1 uncharacterized protein DUF1480 [Sodalis ligni]